MACVFIGTRLKRKFLLYVCATQDSADRHVQSIATLFERIGIERSIGKYGNSKGWRRNQLRAANGFSVEGLGLDVAARGIKLDENRPGAIIFDDIDHEHDTPAKVRKKIDLITKSIIPAGSEDVAILFLQNLIHDNGVVSQLSDNRATFLATREVPPIVPAILGLKLENRFDEELGRNRWFITEGEPTWEGQSVALAQQQLDDMGKPAFLREVQHQVKGVDGFFFDSSCFRTIGRLPVDIRLRLCRAWDLAATQDGGDFTVGVLLGFADNGVIYILDVIRHQLEPHGVRKLILRTAARDAKGEVWAADEYEQGQLMEAGVLAYSFADNAKGRVKIHLPQDPGQAGKDQGVQLRDLLVGYDVTVQPVSGKKAVRARGIADKVNASNCYLIDGDWNFAFIEEYRQFREDEDHEYDDQVDAGADAHDELAPKLDDFAVTTMPSRSNPIAIYKPR